MTTTEMKLTERRTRIRELLREQLPEIQYLARAAEYRLQAPDPESGLRYLRECRDLCNEVLTAATRRAA